MPEKQKPIKLYVSIKKHESTTGLGATMPLNERDKRINFFIFALYQFLNYIFFGCYCFGFDNPVQYEYLFIVYYFWLIDWLCFSLFLLFDFEKFSLCIYSNKLDCPTYILERNKELYGILSENIYIKYSEEGNI